MSKPVAMKANKGGTSEVISPLRLLACLLFVLFFAEAIIMFTLPLFFHSLVNPVENFADSVLLILISAPFLWFFIVRPLRNSAEAKATWATALLEHVVDGVVIFDVQGIVKSWNHAAEVMFGYSAREVIGQHLNVLFFETEGNSEHVAHLYGQLDSLYKNRRIRQDTQGRRKDGSSLQMNISVSMVKLAGDTAFIGIIRDISERKHSEEVLRESEEHFRLLVQHAPDAIFIQTDGCFSYVNQACLALLGAKDEDDLLGLPVMERIHPDFKESVRKRIKTNNYERQMVPALEEQYLKLDGTVVDVEASAVPFDYQGEQGALVFMRDITERKRAEDALRESEARFRTLCDSAPIGIFLSDCEGNNNYCNPRWEEITGMSAAEGRGKGWNKAIHPDDREEIGKIWLEASTTGRLYCHEHRQLTPQGKTIWVRALATPVKNPEGTVLGHVGTLEDITELKRAEKALKKFNNELENRVTERTKELAATIENMQVEIAVRKIAEERVLRLNRLYAVLSETNHTIVHTRDRDTLFNDICRIAVQDGCFKLAWVGLVDEEAGKMKMVAAKGVTGYLDDIRITANEEPAGLGPTGISVREGSYCICNDFLGSPITRPWHERGRAHGIRASASIALKQEGQVIGALTLYADKKDFFDQQQVALFQQMGADVSFALDNIVRETRRQEAERALLEETAERLRAMEFLREKEQMLIQQSRQAAMGEMIGNIAHQWRQPLNTLGLTIQQLSLYHDLGEFTREFLDQNVSSSMEIIQHMSNTIDDFRNYFSPDKEKIEFKVSEAIVNTLSLLEGSLQNPQISIEIVVKDTPVINGHQNEFAQVLLNILINARDAFIEREIDNPRVTITIRGEDGCAVVTVADNAGGIPEEIMGKVFDPYFTTKGPQRGTGIGLFMSKAIIEKNMGGRLAVRNIANGAEFRIEVRSGIHI